MSKLIQYKTQIDNSDRSAVSRIIAIAKDDEEMEYVDKQHILGYAYYKIDSFEDAIICMRNAMSHINEMRKHDRDAYKDFMSNSLFDFLSGYYWGKSDSSHGVGGGECCSCCSILCGVCCVCDCFWEDFAEQSDCCVIRNCAPTCSNCSANICACGLDNCCTAPLVACTNCCF